MHTNSNQKKRIIIGISGGVDSAVSAHLLKEAGHEVHAIFMKNWEESDANGVCPAEVDYQDAAAVCEKLNIPLEIVNFSSEYWQRVFTHFLSEYRAGRTPNPDILCNKEIKFNAFLNYAKQKGADLIATGHYAEVIKNESGSYLKKGTDTNKDQSYFLHALSDFQLSQSIFPVGHLTKPEVRKIASEIGLPNHAKKDSTGICFIGEKKFKQFLNEYLPAKPGVIKTIDGKVIGQHDGLLFYTIGQRQGLGLGGQKNSAELPWYVAKKDLDHNELIVVQGEHPALYQTELTGTEVHWIHPPKENVLNLTAKTRYRQADQPCCVERTFADGKESVKVTFKDPQRAITPGQSVVFYQDTICLGGAIISDLN